MFRVILKRIKVTFSLQQKIWNHNIIIPYCLLEAMQPTSIIRLKGKNTYETLLTNLTTLWEELIDVIVFFRGYIMINFKMINVTRHVSLNHFSSRIYPLYIYLNQHTEIFNYSYICLHAHKIFIFYKFVYLYFT